MRSRMILTLAVMIVTASAGCRDQVPADWQRAPTVQGFTLYVPPDFQRDYEAGQGIDSEAGTLVAPGIKLSYECGWYCWCSPDTVTHYAFKGAQVRRVSVKGASKALLGLDAPGSWLSSPSAADSLFPYAVLLCAEKRNGRGPQTRLALLARCSTPEKRELAIRILRTASF